METAVSHVLLVCDLAWVEMAVAGLPRTELDTHNAVGLHCPRQDWVHLAPPGPLSGTSG